MCIQIQTLYHSDQCHDDKADCIKVVVVLVEDVVVVYMVEIDAGWDTSLSAPAAEGIEKVAELSF